MPSLKIKKGNGNPKAAKIRSTEVYIDGKMKKAGIYDRDKLLAGDVIQGPAIITEMDSTALVHADCKADIDAYGNILITPKKHKA